MFLLTTLIFLLAASLAVPPLSPETALVSGTLRVYPPVRTLLPVATVDPPPTLSWTADPVLLEDPPSPAPLNQTPAPAETTVGQGESGPQHWTIGRSAEGRSINVYRFGSGPARIAVIGGIHGGFEGNTVVLVWQMVYYFYLHPETVPSSTTLYLVPNANPDGFVRGVGEDARLNGNGVDLNRNWDYIWQEYYDWLYGETLYGGPAAFSEPETRALWGLVSREDVTATIFYHSMGGFVTYPWDESDSSRLANCFCWSTGYGMGDDSSFEYPITGDASSYLGSQGLAAIDVELTDHEDPEWERNLSGLLEGIRCWVEGGGK